MDFASRISVTCFAASYAIAFAGELARLLWPTRWTRWLTTGAAAAGMAAQTLFLMSRGLREHRLPTASQFESLITVSWLIGVIYLYLLVRDRRLSAGVFLLPVILGLIGFAATLSERGFRPSEAGHQVIGQAHGLLLLVGTVLVVVAFVAALMYLVKVRQLKVGSLLAGTRLPSLERLDRVNTVAVHLAWPLLTVGIGLGLWLQQLGLTDPKVLTTLLAWALFTVLAHYQHQPEKRGRRIAVLTLVAGAVVLISVLGDPLFGTGHQSMLGGGPMKLYCVGFNWKTPVSLRERLAIDAAALPRALAGFREQHAAGEIAVLSTCNRTELYAARTDDGEGFDNDDLGEYLSRFHSLPLSDFCDHLYWEEGTETARHLFKVASGLDSLVLGEPQILGQVKEAYQAATQANAVGPTLHALFQKALAVAKRVHTETALSKGRLSIASAAVDYIRGVFEHFGDKTLLVIGAGKMAELALTHLVELGPAALLVCNRSRERAEPLAARFQARVRPWEELTAALTEADIVISSTGAEQAIVTAAQFREIMKARRQKLTAIVDIAVPRDFDPAIGDLENVFLKNIDDLEEVRFKTLRSREREFDKALKIVDAETAAFQAALHLQQTAPVIGRLEREYHKIMEQELEWLMPQLNGISDEQRDRIRHFAHRLKNKFLHPPKAALREEAKAGGHHGLLDAIRRIFGLSD